MGNECWIILKTHIENVLKWKDNEILKMKSNEFSFLGGK